MCFCLAHCSLHYAAIPLEKWKLEIQARSPPQHPFSSSITISDKIWRKMSLSLSISLVLPQISLVKYYETIKILMQIFVYFKLHFHNEGLDCEKNYFEMFFCDWPLLSSWKISAFTVQPFTFFFYKKMAFFIIFVGRIFFLQNIYGFTPVKKILSYFDQKWAQTKQLLSKKISTLNCNGGLHSAL